MRSELSIPPAISAGRRKGGVKIDLNRKKSVISPGRCHLPGEMAFLHPNVYRVLCRNCDMCPLTLC